MITRIRAVLLAAAVVLAGLVPVVAAAPAQAHCLPGIHVSHNSGGVTAKLTARCSGISWRGYARSATHGSAGIWRLGTAPLGTTSSALTAGTIHGGWQWETTGGGTIHTVPTF